ncbi:MAG: DUF6273 domain-containing protein, partial [Clostridia bacterium]|nr:DUF6273 domain-containing protein [Clostridia bacterium]
MEAASDEETFKRAAAQFHALTGFKNSDQLYTKCLDIAKEKAEEARIAAEKRTEAKKKRNKFILVAALCVTAIIVLAILISVIINNVIIPQINYNNAVLLKENGKYEEAIAAFEALDEYKDSKQQITAIKDEKYNVALNLYNAGKYSEAITAFEALNGYKDSTTQITECKYCIAVNLYNSGKYSEAITAFEALDGYKDSASYASDALFRKQKSGLANVSVGSTIKFGAYEQDNNTNNGKEEIEWQVLAKEGTKILVISKYALDCKLYNTSKTSVTWETCSLRKWLNNTFYKTAFDANDSVFISKSTVSADKNPSYSTNPGNATSDNVFLLSIAEVNKYF